MQREPFLCGPMPKINGKSQVNMVYSSSHEVDNRSAWENITENRFYTARSLIYLTFSVDFGQLR